jgi:streptogramin lyase
MPSLRTLTKVSHAFVLALAAVAAPAAKITEFPIPTAASGATGITSGPDGRLWFIESSASKVAAVTTAGVFTEYPTAFASTGPLDIAAVPRGRALLFTQQGRTKLGLVSLDPTVTVGELDGTVNGGRYLTIGPEGRAWITTSQAWFAVPFLANAPAAAASDLPGHRPVQRVALGADGLIWFTYVGSSSTPDDPDGVASCSPETASCVEYSLGLNAGPGAIALGPDGNLWFARAAATLSRIAPGPVITEFPIEQPARDIAAGPDGNLWVTQPAFNAIARVTPAGIVTRYTIPTPSAEPRGITAGPDGNIWFVEGGVNNKIGRLRVFVPGDVDDDGDADVQDVFYLINFLFAGGSAPK